MALFTRLSIAEAKLSDYLLDRDHPDGGSKAKFFLGRGFSRDRPGELARALNAQAAGDHTERSLVNARDRDQDKRMIAVGPIGCPDGSKPVIKSIWQFQVGSDTASFVTAYPVRRRTTPN